MTPDETADVVARNLREMAAWLVAVALLLEKYGFSLPANGLLKDPAFVTLLTSGLCWVAVKVAQWRLTRIVTKAIDVAEDKAEHALESASK